MNEKISTKNSAKSNYPLTENRIFNFTFSELQTFPADEVSPFAARWPTRDVTAWMRSVEFEVIAVVYLLNYASSGPIKFIGTDRRFLSRYSDPMLEIFTTRDPANNGFCA